MKELIIAIFIGWFIISFYNFIPVNTNLRERIAKLEVKVKYLEEKKHD